MQSIQRFGPAQVTCEGLGVSQKCHTQKYCKNSFTLLLVHAHPVLRFGGHGESREGSEGKLMTNDPGGGRIGSRMQGRDPALVGNKITLLLTVPPFYKEGLAYSGETTVGAML